MLVVLVRYPETVAEDALALWEEAQQPINEDHIAFAKSRGYDSPIVVFDNTNLMIDPVEVDNPHSPNSVRAAVERRGISRTKYQIVMAIDINPHEGAARLFHTGLRSLYISDHFGQVWSIDHMVSDGRFNLLY